MKIKLFLLFALCTLSTAIFSQSAHKRYTGRMTQDGMCYFFSAAELKDTEGISHFDYDITYLDWQDSITINFTAHTPSADVPSKLAMTNGNNTYMCDNHKHLYIEFRKKGYTARMTSRYALKDFQQLLRHAQPLRFTFEQDGQLKSAAYKPKAWEKERKTLTQIFQLIQSTR